MVEFNILGPLEVLHQGRMCTPTPPKVRTVLGLLLLRANQPVFLESLIEEVWGMEPPPSAVTTIQTYIYHLRKLFTQEGLNPAGGELLTTKACGYVLQVEEYQLDAARFRRLAEDGQALLADGNLARASATLHHALSLWKGSALANVVPGTLSQAHIVHLEEQRINVLESRIQADIELGRGRQLISELRSLVATYPLHEWFHGQLIATLSRAGRRGEALQAYHRLRTILSEELGLDPSPELQRMHHQILTIGAPENVRPYSAEPSMTIDQVLTA